MLDKDGRDEYDQFTGYLWQLPNLAFLGRGRFVQVHGASGSGKTTLVRAVMEKRKARPEEDSVYEIFHSSQKQPVATVISESMSSEESRPLLIVGHYRVACGGADTLKHRALPYALARQALDMGYDVLLEGIFVSLELKRVVEMQEDGFDRHAVFLDVPMEVCEESVQLRREAKGSLRRPLKQMADTYPRIRRTYERMAEQVLPHLHWVTGDDNRACALNLVQALFDRGE